MKKLWITLLAALLLVAGAGCGDREGGGPTPDVPVESLIQEIRDAYGEDYLPNTPMSDDDFGIEFGLSPALVEEWAGELPMIGGHPDRVVIIRAAKGKADEVERILNQIREEKIASEMQYPMNIAKTNAAQVVRRGDYVAFLLVGAPGELDPQSEEAAQFARDQVQKAVDAFEAALS